MYFEKAGKENTEKCLEIARDEAKKRGIKYMVVASTSGETGVQAARMLKDTGIKPIIVTHATSFKEPGLQLCSEETKKEIEDLGGVVYTGTDTITGYQIAFGRKNWVSPQQLIASTLWMFCQGMKVCVECVAMAADAGLIPVENVVSVAGTGKGADTAVIIDARATSQLFDMKIREILAKPANF